MKSILTIAFALSTFFVHAQDKQPPKMDNIVVYGEGFEFAVKEPVGWIGDMDNAEQFQANLIFYKSKEDLANGGAIVQLTIFKKQDEKTEDDLAYDIEGYQKEYKDLKQQDISISHKEYKCYSKLVYAEGKFYQYLVYINCGVKFKKGISVAMNISKRQASEEELKTFRDIIASLVMLIG